MSPGLATGQAFIYRAIMDREHDTYDIEPADVAEALRRIDQSVEQAVHNLERMAERVADQLGTHTSEIFIAQKLILQDARGFRLTPFCEFRVGDITLIEAYTTSNG